MHGSELAPMEPSLRSWLRERVAHYARREPADIDPSVSLTNYGLDSVYALSLCGDLEDHLGVVLEPTVVWDHPTIEALIAHVEEMLGGSSRRMDAG
ncbi:MULTISPECIES: acyl carrier protein [Thermomonosporaceae]|uniref:acyl carrier protein n=1 Tax=Thermomonosporaceae TaxID=2012 RepID=UPI00255AD14A|nr:MULTISPECIES: acyl carrier protein [Thermomonosporaceae]MDL4774212.1 acyl carrier protein [Actinomadura xylanilytica]